MPSRRGLGSGPDARFHTFERGGPLKGARFVLRRPAADAFALAVGHLVAEGFVEREDGLGARLRELDSPWLARAVEIGTASGSWARRPDAYANQPTPFPRPALPTAPWSRRSR